MSEFELADFRFHTDNSTQISPVDFKLNLILIFYPDYCNFLQIKSIAAHMASFQV